MEKISLLWPDKPVKQKRMERSVLDDIGITAIVDAVFVNDAQRNFATDLMEQMSLDIRVVRYRQEILKELYENPEFMGQIEEALKKIKNLDAAQKSHIVVDKKSGLLTLIDRLNELQPYIDVILALNESLHGAELKLEGFFRIKEMVFSISHDRGFRELTEDIHEIMEDMSLYQSVTLGLNLDSLFHVEEVVFLSVNQYRHKKKLPMLTRFGHFLQEAVATNSNLEDGVVFSARGGKQAQDPRMKNLEPLLNDDLEALTKKMWQILQKYVDLSGSALTDIIPELEFYLGFAHFFRMLKENDQPVCMPELFEDENRKLFIRDCYNGKLFLKNQEEKKTQNIVYNDFTLDDTGNIFILTGPNSGGKTTYTQAVGCCVLLAGCGLAVPASEYKGTLFDLIFTHFPASEEETVHLGRLGEEARRISEIMSEASAKSMVLFNETYSSTSFSEGMYLAEDLVRALKYRGIATVYNTHMHELAAEIPKLNESPGLGSVDSLVMGMEEGIRSYKVLRRPPEESSYAKDIAQKYGVTYEQLIAM